MLILKSQEGQLRRKTALVLVTIILPSTQFELNIQFFKALEKKSTACHILIAIIKQDFRSLSVHT